MRDRFAAFEAVKWLALLAMVVDHINLIVLDGSQPWMHAVGRFAAPAFGVCFGIGLAHSRDPAAAAYRLMAPAAVAGIAWWLAGHPEQVGNILFTFALCALAAACATISHAAGVLGLATAMAVVHFVQLEAGYAFVILVAAAYLAERTGAKWLHVVAAGPFVAAIATPGLVAGLLAPHLARRLPWNVPRHPGVLAWAYPAHIAALAGLHAFVA